MELVRAIPLALLATIALTAAKHTPPPAAPPAAAAGVPTIKSGVEQWRAGDYAAAVAIWQPFANAGDPDALFNMGQAYKLGRGVAADAATARDYYRKAANKGHLPAQANLGIALFQAGEKPEAIKWLKTAADRGEARAQYVLGIAAINGDGTPRSQSLGYGYLLRAQASGLPQAVTALGTIAPGLSPADRTAGEAIAASLAAGAGVPSALAAGPRPIGGPPARTASIPVITPPAATSAPTPPVPLPATPAATPPGQNGVNGAAVATGSAPVAPARPLQRPAAVAADQAPTAAVGSVPPAAAAVRPATVAVLPAAPRPAAAVPLREPTPAQADTAASRPRPTIATVDVPASRPAAAADPLAAPPPRVVPAEVAHVKPPPERAAAPLKPFETVVEPAHKADGWRVQLGAFSARKLADAAWNDVKSAAAPAKPIFAADGPVTKLQMGPFPTRDAAKAACAKLTGTGHACFVTQG